MSYAQLNSGLILPEQLARSVMSEWMFGIHGAHRSTSPANKNTRSWITSDGSADADSLADLPTLRSQSRDLIRNEALPAGAINVVVTAVVGTGIVPQSRLDFEYLGITEEQAAEWERRVERLFAHWADTPACDAENRLNFWRMQEAVQRSKLENGDVFAVRRYTPRTGRMLGLSWQLVEADRVATPSAKLSDKSIRAGIERNSTGEPIACHIMQVHPSEAVLQATSQSDAFTRIAMRDNAGSPLVLHIARRLRLSQTRGIPYLAPVIELLKQLSRYTEAEVTAAVISGMFSVFVKSPAAGTAASPLNSMPMGIPGMVGGTQSPPPQGGQVTKLQSGIIMDLAPGEEIQIAEAQRPNTAFDPFVMALLRQIGTALEIPFEVLIRHFTASYSASRAAIQEAWRFFLKERDALIMDFCQPVWEAVVSEAVAIGLLDAPGFFDDPLRREAWLACDWIGQNAPHLDPVKEANAAKLWNDLNILSLQDIASGIGKDFDRQIRRITQERKMLAGIMPK